MPAALRFLEEMEYESIIKIKWVLTILFTLLFLALTLIAVKMVFPEKKFLRYTVISYLVILCVAAILMMTGIVFPAASAKCYEFSRYLMGFAQSPLVLMILIPAFKLSSSEKTNFTN
jgi:hypothetical protein